MRQTAVKTVLLRLASLKLTLATFILLGVGVGAAYIYESIATSVLALPMLLFAVNLIATVLTNRTFHQNKALLSFHLTLIVMVLLIAAGRLTYLNGTLELATDIPFDGTLTSVDAGPFHNGDLDKVQFVSKGFTIHYDAGLVRGDTLNPVIWVDEHGQHQEFVVRDYYPLVIQGYRFYTSHNKGFAPEFTWLPDDPRQEPYHGAIHLPSYPLNEFRQALEWTPPGSMIKIWTKLQINESLLDPYQETEFRIPDNYDLIIRHDQQRYLMQPGDQIQLPGGRLQFHGLQVWMGYSVFYDWTMNWLLLCSLIAVLCLALHFWRKFNQKPWDAA